MLTDVRPPSETDEGLRDLCRSRDDVRVGLLRARSHGASTMRRVTVAPLADVTREK